MSAIQTFTGDLRSDAKEFNRDKNSRVKWAHGQSFGPGRREEDGRPRPAKIAPHIKSTYPGPMKARTAFNKDMASASGDSSADEDVEHPSDAPDAEIAYSYDATRGPSHGSQILNHALDKAIERFETKETDKLIKNEYEVLDIDAEDTLSPRPMRRAVAPEDEEYEFVDG
ncbi:Nn.00g059820.m01.CDS01 [Neocucurbitaria sp. VM-36]